MPSTLLQARPALIAFGDRVRQIREHAMFTQAQLGERAGLSERFVASVELGYGNPSLATIVLLALALDCDVADFFS